jgi:hypothetical protein
MAGARPGQNDTSDDSAQACAGRRRRPKRIPKIRDGRKIVNASIFRRAAAAVLFLTIGLLNGGFPTAPEDQPHVYACRKIDRELTLDGRLSDPLWKSAAAVRLVLADSGGPADRLTEARLLYSSTTLYIGFFCEDDYVWGTKTEPDSDIYAEECVEAFLNPAGSPYQYYEINVSPKNVVFDACILNPRSAADPAPKITGLKDYHPAGLVTRVFIDGAPDVPGGAKSWSAEYAIPLSQLIGAPHVPPRKGDLWRMNLYRIDAPKDGKSRYYAWNPTEKIDFHRPWRFGILKFE